MHSIIIGTYQGKLSPGYIQDSTLCHINDLAAEDEDERVFEIDGNFNEPGFIKIRAKSRFRHATIYYVWIAFDLEHNNVEDEARYWAIIAPVKVEQERSVHAVTYQQSYGFARYEDNIRYPSLRTLYAIINAQMWRCKYN